ncbi:MAG: cell wall hydrolase [Lachnospiraceae bacterium]
MAGYIALCVLLIILAAIISQRLSAQEARAASEPPAPVYSSAALAAQLAVAPDVAAHEPQIPEPPAEPEPEPRYEEITAEERELLARVVYAEANTETLEGQIAVAQVVLNRVRSESFPDTVSEVIYQERQFSTAPILDSVTPTENNYEAVDLAFELEVVPYDVLYFSRGAENDRVWGADRGACVLLWICVVSG